MDIEDGCRVRPKTLRLSTSTDTDFTGDTLHTDNAMVTLCKALGMEMVFFPPSGCTVTWG